MTSQDSALARFERAVKIGNPNIVLAAAHKLPKPMLLRDALRVVLVLAAAAPERFPPAAARFGAQLVSERKLSVAEAQLAFAALQTLGGPERETGREALCALDTPIIVLSHRPDEVHRIRVLDRGGDDVIAKPFSYPELRARVAAVLRRAESRRHRRQLRFGPLTIDLAARQVRLGQQPIDLAPKEYELLVTLASDPHRVFTREELLRSVWGYRTPSRTVDSHACRLRQRLSAHPQRLVINVWGLGYRFCDPLDATQPTTARVTS